MICHLFDVLCRTMSWGTSWGFDELPLRWVAASMSCRFDQLPLHRLNAPCSPVRERGRGRKRERELLLSLSLSLSLWPVTGDSMRASVPHSVSRSVSMRDYYINATDSVIFSSSIRIEFNCIILNILYYRHLDQSRGVDMFLGHHLVVCHSCLHPRLRNHPVALLQEIRNLCWWEPLYLNSAISRGKATFQRRSAFVDWALFDRNIKILLNKLDRLSLIRQNVVFN